MQSFQLTEQEITNVFENITFEPSSLGAFTLCRTYLRPIFEDDKFVRNETFKEMMTRVVNGMFSMIKERQGDNWVDSEWRPLAIESLEAFANFKVLPPGRGLWACGTKAPKLALFNCSFNSSSRLVDGIGKYFATGMNGLMCGIGLGIDTDGADKFKLVSPYFETELSKSISQMVPKTSTADSGYLYANREVSFYETYGSEPIVHAIKDNKKGWCDSVEMLIDSYTEKTTGPIIFDYSKIRKKGVYLKKFGGTSSGPAPLFECHASIRDLLERNLRNGCKTFSGRLIIDIINVIQKTVVSGNIRRSSGIALSEDEMIALIKDYFSEQNNYRHGFSWASNNSFIFTDETMEDGIYEETLDRMLKKIGDNGEPGLFYLSNVRKYSRTGFPADYKDKLAKGTNPCGEISLEETEICNIAETFISNINSTDPEVVAKYTNLIVLYCCIVSCQKTDWEDADKTKERNNRIGISLTGISEFIQMNDLSNEQLKVFLRGLYDKVQVQTDKWCNILNMNRCIKTTTVKPSGTVSLLGNVTPGIHPEHSDYYMRTVRYNQSDKHFTYVFEKYGYRVEPDVVNPTTTNVVYFPEKAKIAGKVTKDNITVDRQMDLAAIMQMEWSDNQVSCTVSYWEDEFEDIRKNLLKYKNQLKGISFLKNGKRGSEKSHKQMPYEAISEETYIEEVSKLKKILTHEDFVTDIQLSTEENLKLYCDGPKCMLTN